MTNARALSPATASIFRRGLRVCPCNAAKLRRAFDRRNRNALGRRERRSMLLVLCK
jgi:hypothetical protein